MRRPSRPSPRAWLAAALALTLAAPLAVAPSVARAQGWLDRAKQKAKERVDRQVDRQVDRALDRAVDSTAATVTGERSPGATPAPDARPAADRRRGTSAAPAAGGAAPAGFDGGGPALVNFDFQPGETPLFVDDFARDALGNFPRRLTYRRGNVEVAQWNGGRWLRVTSGAALEVPLRAPLPERFTLELDVAPPANVDGTPTVNALDVAFGEEMPGRWQPLDDSRETIVTAGRVGGADVVEAGVFGAGVDANTRTRTAYPNGKPFTLRVSADARYLKVYVDGERVANVPNAAFRRARRILLRVNASPESPAYLGAVRVMAGGRPLYDALAERGRVATQGILFATGSDRIRTESAPTLDEIGAMLRAHPELRLAIEGHTDDVGDAAANRQLSERRAAAVRQALVTRYGVDGARLEAQGHGASRPAASNATPEGRQQNRRVELVRR